MVTRSLRIANLPTVPCPGLLLHCAFASARQTLPVHWTRGGSAHLQERPHLHEEVEELELLVASCSESLIGHGEERCALCLRQIWERRIICDCIQQPGQSLLAAVAIKQESLDGLLHIVGALRFLGATKKVRDLPFWHGTGYLDECIFGDLL